ncbi:MULTISPECIES: DUF4400 domain-containing protein [Cupriavidus]|uniref:DUF4400 domain-containing protein n=1 Tax=Cupriavidus taiwanensis TaxID=164546 RepID=A0A7Z7JI98_9BURK|nr:MULTISPECIES: DUF4400 domain-containing protein [Cupriavidus]NOV26627.1 DUF4400 domain-containing protein [Cupriavidus necator]NSX13250.1 DUF4400 domain-containing protein [Cupriavidus taiwanensis]SOZ18889.1 conserved membrane hypothetical protein [Cupriavidus taiwanensis]SOZ97006.1 conserved membrane hypothetical protein [Cupriavidus taiwanensis]SPC25919.1 conserved membrane hypothetical protein [Cupriavidus taiwanensis]
MASSRFVSHVRVWLLVSPLMICALVPFIQSDAAFEVSDAEQASVSQWIGQAGAREAASQANDRFDRWLVKSGALQASFSGSDADTALPDAGASEFGRGWMRRFWLTVYRAVYRAAVAHHWLFGGFILFAALLNDGAVSRKIRAAGAGFANPVTFHVAAHGLLLCFGLGATALLLPISLLAHWWTLGVCLVGLFSWRLAASFHVGK